MDDISRTSHDKAEPQAGDAPAGTGWSTPPDDSNTPPRAPWSQPSHDTGSIPRPNDTQQIPTAAPPAGASAGAADDPGTSAPGVESAGDSPLRQSAPPPNGDVPPVPEAPTPGSNGKRNIALIAAVALGASLLGGAAGAGIYAATDDDGPETSLTSLGNEPAEVEDAADLAGVEEVAANVTPSVVSIGIQGPRGRGSGSGVIISSDGQILTNAHVAQAGEEGTITVTFHDGSTAEAETVGMDADTDVAVIQAVGVSDLQPAELGDSDALNVGQDLLAFGSPLGLDGTVTRGIVSALNRPVTAGDSPDQLTTFEAIQTDASINPGNSGGPLVNMAGQVVGINTAIASTGVTPTGADGSIGLGFAIPINTARFIAEQLIEDGDADYARIGISVSNAPIETPGAAVEEVTEDSAAAEAELEAGDIITHFDGRVIPDATSLVAAVRSHKPGDVVSIAYLRDGEEHTVEVTLGSSAETT